EVRAGVVVGQAENKPSPKDLRSHYGSVQQEVLALIGNTPLSELPSLAAWRSAFRRFGVNPTKYRSAVEALLRRLTKKGDIPSINALVDIGNLVSIRYQVPVAVFDVERINGSILVRLATGEENFTPLFLNGSEHPEPGEVIFIDGNGLVAARRWCWRQSDQSASRIDTRSVMIVTEAHHPEAEDSVGLATAKLSELCGVYLGGDWVSGLVTPENPIFD
ncbi:MAG: phenylalanine--tRNA ligase beta subunit-related protein, partial [Anaerolineales bacterium]